MKTKFKLFAICHLLSVLCLSARAQGTAFTYQGRLDDGAGPANGSFDLTFSIFGSSSGGSIVAGPFTNSATVVNNGLFTVPRDFGAGVFNGDVRWLEITVSSNEVASSTTLSPRQPLTPAPYAIYAASAGTGGGSPWSLNGNDAYYNAGNVGIGTSTPAHRLSLSGGPAWTDNGWAGALELQNGAAIGWQANQAGQQFGMGHSFGGFYLFRTASDPGTTGSQAMYDFVVDDSGNVGIGTTAPTPGIRLEVNGAALLTPGGSGGHIQFGAPNAESGMTIIGSARADLRFDGSTIKLVAGPLGGPPASTSGIAIGTNGNVGIGTASPGVKLEVAGDARISGQLNVNHFAFANVTMALQARSSDDIPFAVYDTDGNGFFYLQIGPNAGAAGHLLSMYGDAKKSSGGTSWGTISDRRLKQDVRAYEPGLNEVLQLRPVRFCYLNDPKRGLTSNHEEVGFIAQEVREVIPDAVTEDKDGYLSLKADPIHWAAINAIQGLNQKLEQDTGALRSELNRKDAEIQQLKHRLEALERILEKQK